MVGEHGVVVTAVCLYWGGIGFESLSAHHCWTFSKSFIPSLAISHKTKNTAFGAEKQKRNSEHSDLCDLEQVTLNHSFKPTIASPFGCKYGTIPCFEDIVSVKGPRLLYSP